MLLRGLLAARRTRATVVVMEVTVVTVVATRMLVTIMVTTAITATMVIKEVGVAGVITTAATISRGEGLASSSSSG